MPSVVFQTASKPRPCVPVNLADVGAVAKLVADSFTLIRDPINDRLSRRLREDRLSRE